jgi:hypothetical protein
MGFLPPISTFMAGMRGEQATSLASWPRRQAGATFQRDILLRHF